MQISNILNEQFIHNAQTIISFDPTVHRKIKTLNGKLEAMPDTSFSKYSGSGISLIQTLPDIEKIFQTVWDTYREMEDGAKNEKLNKALKSHLFRLLTFIEGHLVKGLEAIIQRYEQDYENQANKGLEKLKDLYRKATIEAQRQNSSSLSTKDPLSLLNRVIEQTASNFEFYCEFFCPGILLDVAKESVQQGKIILKGILEGNYPPFSEKNIASITWFLMYCAIQERQGFFEGAFVIEEEGKLFRYLQQGGIPRPASHFVGRCEKDTSLLSWIKQSSSQYGIDIGETSLPAKKRTLLFSQIDPLHFDKKVGYPLFLKPENYNVSWNLEGLYHLYEYILAQGKKAFITGADDLIGMRKERIPSAIRSNFGDLIRHLNNNWDTFQSVLEKLNKTSLSFYKLQDPFVLEKAMDHADTWGIAYMYEFAKQLGESCPPDFLTTINPFIKALSKYHDLTTRTGNEVYLSQPLLSRYINAPLKI